MLQVFFFVAGALYISTRTADPMMNVLWLSVSLGSLGLTMSASWSSVISMGGKFAGSVSGWMNFWGNIGGVLAPTVTAWFATNYGWQAALGSNCCNRYLRCYCLVLCKA